MIPGLHEDSRRRLPLVGDRPQFLVGLVADSTTIAHLGCTDAPYTTERIARGELLHAALVEQAMAAGGTVVGIDVDASGIERLQEALPGTSYLCCPFPEGLPLSERGRYDLVIAGEVLEHVANVGVFLGGCRQLLAPGGRLCVTVPNACSPKIGFRALAGTEVVHPDHWVYFGPKTLDRCLRSTGLSPTYMATYLATPGPFGRVFNWGLRAAHWLRKGPVGEGLIAIAVEPPVPSS
jgi:SAM-dependent methyltransferase